MMTIEFETYQTICELLAEECEGEPTYSVEEIAEMVGVSIEVVQYVSRAESDAM
jgi:hypothetical protein